MLLSRLVTLPRVLVTAGITVAIAGLSLSWYYHQKGAAVDKRRGRYTDLAGRYNSGRVNEYFHIKKVANKANILYSIAVASVSRSSSRRPTNPSSNTLLL